MVKQEETIKRLAQLLKDAGVDYDTAFITSLRLRRPGKAEQMIEWLERNRSATVEEICEKREEIARITGLPLC